jgi:hypothetical protein
LNVESLQGPDGFEGEFGGSFFTCAEPVHNPL